MFTGWDIFTCKNERGINDKQNAISAENVVFPSQFNKDFLNINNLLLKDVFIWSQKLWDMIDWNQFFELHQLLLLFH